MEGFREMRAGFCKGMDIGGYGASPDSAIAGRHVLNFLG